MTWSMHHFFIELIVVKVDDIAYRILPFIQFDQEIFAPVKATKHAIEEEK